jgi:hypothetical protein
MDLSVGGDDIAQERFGAPYVDGEVVGGCYTTGRVVNCVGDQSSRGTGIEFTEIDANDKKGLEACLTELAAAQKLPPVPSP